MQFEIGGRSPDRANHEPQIAGCFGLLNLHNGANDFETLPKPSLDTIYGVAWSSRNRDNEEIGEQASHADSRTTSISWGNQMIRTIFLGLISRRCDRGSTYSFPFPLCTVDFFSSVSPQACVT